MRRLLEVIIYSILAFLCIFTITENRQRIDQLEAQVAQLEEKAQGIAAQIVYENLAKDSEKGGLVDTGATCEAYIKLFKEQQKGPFEAKFPPKKK